MQILSVFGTRSEAIKLASAIRELRRHPDRVVCKVRVTAQHQQESRGGGQSEGRMERGEDGWKMERERKGMKHQEAPGMQLTSIILADRPVPQSGRLDMKVSISATVSLSAEEARRKVNRFVHREISYLMRGDPPSLVVADRVYWRVPVILTFPSYGPLGTVGSIDVDVETGELNVSADRIVEIQHRAQDLAARTSPQTAPAG